MAEYYNGGPQAVIYLDKREGDLEALYNILAYYRLSVGYVNMLNLQETSAVLCEKLFQDVRESLGRA